MKGWKNHLEKIPLWTLEDLIERQQRVVLEEAKVVKMGPSWTLLGVTGMLVGTLELDH